MPLKVYLNTKFGTTHENQGFDDLIKNLSKDWEKSEELIIVIGNFYCEGKEIDALIIKKDSISVVDFKNYGGKITFSENGKWYCDKDIIKGGSKKNPYIQIRDNKFAIFEYLKKHKEIFAKGNVIDFYHISGIALFHKDINFDKTTIPYVIANWFFISDMNSISHLLYQITSKKINLSNDEILNFVKSFDVDEYNYRKRSYKTTKIVSTETEINEEFIFTNSQLKALEKIDGFIGDNTQQVFILKGAVNTGKKTLIREIKKIFESKKRYLKLVAPRRRIAEMLSKDLEYKSIYSEIYSHTPKKQKITIKIGDEEFQLFQYPLAKNNDSDDTVYIINESQLLSNKFSKLDFFIFGSGYIISDLIDYCDLKNTKRKIIFVGDDKQIHHGNFDLQVFSQSLIQNNLGLIFDEFELREVIKSNLNEIIIDNCIEIRNSITRNIFNHFEINDDGETVVKISEDDFVNSYIKMLTKDPFGTIVIRDTNKRIKELNYFIREKLYNRTNVLDKGDLVLLYNNINVKTSAGYPDKIYLSSGEFGEITYVSDIIEEPLKVFYKNGLYLKGRTEEIRLRFRDIGIKFSCQNSDYKIKISEDFLLSNDVALSKDHFIALMTLFSKRHDNLEKNTDDFLEALENDPYINAANIRLGYSITAEKAQGRKWNNVFVDLKSSVPPTNESYYRWVYTAMTRCNSSLFTLNTPVTTPFIKLNWLEDNVIIKDKEEKYTIHYNTDIEIHESNKDFFRVNKFPNDKPCLKALFQFINNSLSGKNIKINKVAHQNYQEIYEFIGINKEKAKINIWYNKEFKITNLKVVSSEPKDFSNLITKSFQTNVLEFKNIDPGYNTMFLDDLFEKLHSKLTNTGIYISNIDKSKNLTQYIFKKDNKYSKINFWYEDSGFFTTVKCQESNSTELTNELRQIILELKENV